METRRLTVELGLPEGSVRIEMEVPTGEVPMGALLPALRTTADAFVAYGAEVSKAAGKAVSCAKGCGACCRQLVPLAPSEARRLADLVEELREPRRSVVAGRFAEAYRRVEEAGLLPALDGRRKWQAGEATGVGMDYFHLGIPCPFLEDESCSIYTDRPIACREYLVTSDPAHCAEPTRGVLEPVPLPTRVWAAVAREEAGIPDTEPAACIPLVLAPRWAAENPGAGEPRPGPQTLKRVFDRFARDRSGERGPG